MMPGLLKEELDNIIIDFNAEVLNNKVKFKSYNVMDILMKVYSKEYYGNPDMPIWDWYSVNSPDTIRNECTEYLNTKLEDEPTNAFFEISFGPETIQWIITLDSMIDEETK